MSARVAPPQAGSLVLGTAGHIDHGKSALVKALTGTDPDRLAEEKRRGITIELGFAQLKLPDGRTMGVVDVPGHERFVRQMIAGATGIDVALMCIAADDGIMPQTVEHLHVLELLGIHNMVVALTKCDLVDEEWAAFMADEIRARLADTPFADAPIVPVSARNRTGIPELLEAIGRAADYSPRAHEEHSFARLPIDRAFSIKGSGTVVTGTLWSGRISPDDELEILPTLKRVRVRAIQAHGKPVDAAEPGSRTALNLASVGTEDVRPGMTLVTPGAIVPTDRFDAEIVYLGPASRKAPLDTGSVARIAHGTSEVPGRILLMNAQTRLEPGQRALAQIRLDVPLAMERGDRFIVRTFSPVEVVGGGEALLCHPRRRTTLSPVEQSLLEALADHDAQRAIDVAIEGFKGLATAESIADATGIGISTCAQRLRHYEEMNAFASIASPRTKRIYYARAKDIASLCSSIENTLVKYHAANPENTGIGKAELLQITGKGLDPDSLDALLALMAHDGRVVLDGAEISHPKAGAGAKKREREITLQVSQVLDLAGLTPPTIDALADQLGVSKQTAYRALSCLEENGQARRVGNFCFSAKAIREAEKTVVTHLASNGPSTATELKDALGISRKHAIPLLEYMDAQGVTRREGDVRKLAGS